MSDTTNIPAFNIFDWIRDGVPDSFLDAVIPAATRNKPTEECDKPREENKQDE